MFITIINDCSDHNAMNRQATRMASFFNSPVYPLGVSDFGHKGSGEIEAAGNLIDTLDAADGGEGIILINVAIRHGKGKRFPNGTPFGYFYYGKTLVIASIDGYCLSLAKKFQLTDQIQLMDIPTVMDYVIDQHLFEKEYRQLVVDSQFRSYQFIPRVAKWLKDGIDLPTEKYPIEQVADIPATMWWVDNFGNCVTTLLPQDVNFTAGEKLTTRFGELPMYERLKDVPNGEAACIIGSSGLDHRRFLSFVIQGKSFANEYGVKTGEPILP